VYQRGVVWAGACCVRSRTPGTTGIEAHAGMTLSQPRIWHSYIHLYICPRTPVSPQTQSTTVTGKLARFKRIARCRSTRHMCLANERQRQRREGEGERGGFRVSELLVWLDCIYPFTHQATHLHLSLLLLTLFALL
jgi:hypothetical protein